MARDTKDIQFRELKDTISQLNTTIAAQTQLINSLQKSLDAANEREAEQSKQNAALKEQIDCKRPIIGRLRRMRELLYRTPDYWALT